MLFDFGLEGYHNHHYFIAEVIDDPLQLLRDTLLLYKAEQTVVIQKAADP